MNTAPAPSSSSPSTSSSSAGTPGPQQWADAILAGLGAPITPTNENLIIAWQKVEGQWTATGPFAATAQNNPLNIESTPAGAPSGKQICDAAGNCTLAFASAAEGVAATVAFIQQYQPAIASALQSSNPNAFLSAVAGWNPGSPSYANQIATAFGSSAQLTGWLKTVENGLGAITGISGITGLFGSVGSITSTLTYVEDVTKHVLDPTWWKRVALGAAGIALFLVGLAVFLSTTQEGQKATSEASSAAELAPLALAA